MDENMKEWKRKLREAKKRRELLLKQNISRMNSKGKIKKEYVKAEEGEEEDQQKYSIHKKDIEEVLVNGIPLGKIMDGKVSEDKLPQHPVKKEEIMIQKISGKIKPLIVGDNDGNLKYKAGQIKNLGIRQIKVKDFGKYYKHHISMLAKNAKTNNDFRPWQKLQRLLNKDDDK